MRCCGCSCGCWLSAIVVQSVWHKSAVCADRYSGLSLSLKWCVESILGLCRDDNTHSHRVWVPPVDSALGSQHTHSLHTICGRFACNASDVARLCCNSQINSQTATSCSTNVPLVFGGFVLRRWKQKTKLSNCRAEYKRRLFWLMMSNARIV